MTPTTLRLSDGAAVRCLDTGGGRAPLILIHGVGLRAEAWGPQIEALARAARVIAVDMPGHGGSDPLLDENALPDFVDWCARVIGALGLGPVSIAGHSMGALIAAGAAVCHPTLVKRTALLSAVHRRDAAARRAVMDRAAQIAAGHVDADAPLSRWFGESPQEMRVRRDVGKWLASVDAGGYAAAYAAFAAGDAIYAPELHRISCPFLAITGADDPNSTPAMSRAMAAAVPGGVSAVIEGHRHMVNLTAPDVVNAHLGAWLKRTAPKEAIQ